MDPRVADAVWKAIEGHLPPRPPDNHPLGCHRLRIPDRDCFQGILVRLVTGCSWDVAARLCRASETTLRGRRTEWLTAGVFDKLVEEAIAGYDKIIGLDLSEVALDGSLHKAPCGGEGTGPNPTDRGKIGWKWSIATDLFGIPIGWVTDGANRNDSVLLEPTLQAVADRGLLADVETLHLDKGYDSFLTTQAATAWGSPTSSAPRRRARAHPRAPPPARAHPRPRSPPTAKPRPRRPTPWACAGPSNEPTPGSPTSASSAATPIGSANNASDRSHSPSPSS